MGVFVSSTGFQKRTLADIKASLITGFQALFGTETDTSDDGPTGQIIGLLSKALANQWDGAQEVYNSYDPSAATGAALDRVCALTGIYRIAAASSHGVAQLYANADNLGAVIPSGRQARRARGSVVFSLSSDTTIAAASCQDIYLKLSSSPNAGDTVTVTTTFGTFTAVTPTALDAATRTSEVIKLIVESINASTWANAANDAVSGVAQLVSSGVIVYPATDTVGGIQETNSDFFLRIVHPTTAFGVSGYSGWTVGLCGSPGTFVCALTGPYALEAHELSEIVTPETGWEAVGNLAAAVTGRNVETDEELRIRRAASFGTGYATETSIKNYLYNHVSGLSSVSVSSNRSSSTDSAGRPPHSFECAVQGGADADVAAAIWASAPAGIQAYGNTTVQVADSQGTSHTVGFSRPSEVSIYARVTYALYSEESFPSDGVSVIRDAILSWAASEFAVGKDVFSGRFLAPIYTATTGLGAVTVQVSADGVAWSDFISIDGRHFAGLPSANLTIVQAV